MTIIINTFIVLFLVSVYQSLLSYQKSLGFLVFPHGVALYYNTTIMFCIELIIYLLYISRIVDQMTLSLGFSKFPT